MSDENKNPNQQEQKPIEEQYAQLKTLYDTVFGEKTTLTKENSKLVSDLKTIKTQFDELKKLEVFKDLNPDRVSEYSQVDEIIKAKGVEVDKIETKYKGMIETLRKEMELKLQAEMTQKTDLKTKFDSYRKNSILLENLPELVKGAPKKHVLEQLSRQFENDPDNENGLLFTRRPVDPMTDKKTTPSEAIDILRDDPDFSFYFPPRAATGSGAHGSSQSSGGPFQLTGNAENDWKAAKENRT